MRPPKCKDCWPSVQHAYGEVCPTTGMRVGGVGSVAGRFRAVAPAGGVVKALPSGRRLLIAAADAGEGRVVRLFPPEPVAEEVSPVSVGLPVLVGSDEVVKVDDGDVVSGGVDGQPVRVVLDGKLVGIRKVSEGCYETVSLDRVGELREAVAALPAGKRPRGRPPAEKPWEAEGLSRQAWYKRGNRKKEGS